MNDIFDDREVEEPVMEEPALVEGRNGKMRPQTDVEWARDYIKDFGEDEYVKFLLENNIDNPKGIKLKDKDLAQRIVDVGLQK